MFESLSDKLKKTLKNLRGQGKLTPEHVDAALREIRMALLEADVNYKVAKDFVEAVRIKAEGTRGLAGPESSRTGRQDRL
jgi:signal recognition particle subunit SRP54